MQISFFEEFPTQENFQKLTLIHFPTKLYLASSSLKEFKKYARSLKKRNRFIREIIYWPVLSAEEGYWLSPFSKRKALLRLCEELQHKKINILWDAEFPIKASLYFSGMQLFFMNYILIKRFFRTYQGKITTAEYFPQHLFSRWIFSVLGLHFTPQNKKRNVVKMLYSSLRSYRSKEWMEKHILAGKKIYGNHFLAGLGLLAPGVGEHEKMIHVEQLQRDLTLCKKAGVKEVILFRLGGLNKEYLDIIS
ncbi:hypothetical protein HZB00_03070 [Candidatus Woesearchaeota archaeon]|nr:hypothetical protein [Candidatus Woesearchaeota archaeon]